MRSTTLCDWYILPGFKYSHNLTRRVAVWPVYANMHEIIVGNDTHLLKYAGGPIVSIRKAVTIKKHGWKVVWVSIFHDLYILQSDFVGSDPDLTTFCDDLRCGV